MAGPGYGALREEVVITCILQGLWDNSNYPFLRARCSGARRAGLGYGALGRRRSLPGYPRDYWVALMCPFPCARCSDSRRVGLGMEHQGVGGHSLDSPGITG